MSTPEPVPPAPGRGAAVWKWTKRVAGCLVLAVLLSCGCGTCGVGGLYWRHHSTLRAGTDEVFRTGLANGDGEAMYRNADEAFRLRYTLEQFLAFLKLYPELLQRDQLNGRMVQRTTLDGLIYLVVRVAIDRGWAGLEMAIYCRTGDDGVVRLLGISNGCDGAVPASLKRLAFRQKSRRDLFD
ncbi:MAG: hypothetical protein JNM56_18670 [Planctomycetia bacterium]|nr:hypothetical protein [Planctomycetia bacterium]